jgi:hypothetical protein
MYFIAHITSSVFINDDERGLHADYGRKPSAFSLRDCAQSPVAMEELAPHEPISRYRHNRTGEACPVQPALRRPPSVPRGVAEGRGVKGTTATPT